MKGEVVAVAAAETGGAPIEVDVVTKIDLHGEEKRYTEICVSKGVLAHRARTFGKNAKFITFISKITSIITTTFGTDTCRQII